VAHGSLHVKDASDQVLMQHLVGRAGGGEAAFVGEHEQAVGEPRGLLQIVQGGDDGAMLLRDEALKLLHKAELMMHVEVRRRLVQKQQIGVLHKRLRQEDALPLAPAQGLHGAFGEAAEADLLQRVVGALAVGSGVAGQPGLVRRAAQQHEVLDGEVKRELRGLPHEGQAAGAFPVRPRACGLPEQPERSRVGQKPPGGAQERCFTAPVRSDQADARP
jgi:hypothetical protein